MSWWIFGACLIMKGGEWMEDIERKIEFLEKRIAVLEKERQSNEKLLIDKITDSLINRLKTSKKPF